MVLILGTSYTHWVEHPPPNVLVHNMLSINFNQNLMCVGLYIAYTIKIAIVGTSGIISRLIYCTRMFTRKVACPYHFN